MPEDEALDIQLPRTISLGKLLKWIGAVVTVLGVAGVLVGYGIWIGSTNSSISTLKDDVKDLEGKDTKSAGSLTKLVATLEQRFHTIELALTKQQSAIEAIHSEIRIRHEDLSYIDDILKNYEPPEPGSSARVTRRERLKRQEEALRAAEKRAALAADTTIGGSSKIVTQVAPEKRLDKTFSF